MTISCHRCGETKDQSRLPRGWKRRADIWCDRCWRESHVLRAIALPVASPISGTWDEFRASLRSGWSAATRLANWCMREYYVRDEHRTPGMEKMPPMPRIYLYPESEAIAPELRSRTRSAITQQVLSKYRASRYKIIWTGEESLPVYRYPYPIPITGQTLRIYRHPEQEGRWCVSIELPGGRWELLLRGGKEFRRQISVLEHIEAGRAMAGEATIYRTRANCSDHRNGMTGRDSGGSKAHFRVMLKIVAWVPKSRRTASDTLRVHTANDAMIVAVNGKDERIWQWHADHVRRWHAEHARQLQHWSDDQKAEQRPVASFQSRREAACKKYRHRIQTAIDTAAMQLVRYAARRRFASIRYDDTDQSWLPQFPWYELRKKIEQKADKEGIAFEQ